MLFVNLGPHCQICILACLLATVSSYFSRKLFISRWYSFAVELDHARIWGLCPSGWRWCSKDCHRSCCIIRALAFQESRRAKNTLNIWGKRKEWVYNILVFAATVYITFFPFSALLNLHLLLRGLFNFKYRTLCGPGKTTERSPNEMTPRLWERETPNADLGRLISYNYFLFC